MEAKDFGSRALSCETTGQLTLSDFSDVNSSSVLFTLLEGRQNPQQGSWFSHMMKHHIKPHIKRRFTALSCLCFRFFVASFHHSFSDNKRIWLPATQSVPEESGGLPQADPKLAALHPSPPLIPPAGSQLHDPAPRPGLEGVRPRPAARRDPVSVSCDLRTPRPPLARPSL